MIDTFVLAQLRAEMPLYDKPLRLHHLRQEGGAREVDLVAELNPRQVIGLEIKARSAPTAKDARHLATTRTLDDRHVELRADLTVSWSGSEHAESAERDRLNGSGGTSEPRPHAAGPMIRGARAARMSPVTATYAYDERPTSGHPLLPGASPAAIRDGLLPADRARFDVAYAAALAESRQSLDLTELFKTLEHWRRVAVLQSDPANYRRMVRCVAETLTGQPVPDDEPLELTRTKACM